MLKRLSKRSYKKKRTSKRRYMKRRPVSGNSSSIKVKRISITTSWTLGNAATSDFWRYVAPTAGNFSNFSEFASVFDQYKVNAIKATYRPRFSGLSGPVTGNTPMTARIPYAAIINDARSTLIPAGTYGSSALQTLLENGGKVIRADRVFSVYFKPQIQCQSSVGAGTYYKRCPYINTSDTTTTMRGFHLMIYEQNFGNNFTDFEWDVYYTFYVTFKNLK